MSPIQKKTCDTITPFCLDWCESKCCRFGNILKSALEMEPAVDLCTNNKRLDHRIGENVSVIVLFSIGKGC